MEKNRCSNCRFWDFEGSDDPSAGLCRRRAPVSNPEAGWNEHRDHNWPWWPHTGEGDWCGDHTK